MPSPKWTFASRFRRNAFGWRSSLPIQRLKEAVSEIRSVARTDRAIAAEGAVLLLEKLSPALEQVDSSSGEPPIRTSPFLQAGFAESLVKYR